MRLLILLAALVATGIAGSSHAGKPPRTAPLVGLMAPDSTFRILSVGRRESHYPYIRSWVEPDTIRFVDVMVMSDGVTADSSGQFSVTGYDRCGVFARRVDGVWRIHLECWRNAR